MSILDEILEKTGLKYEDLNAVEKETLNNWMESLSKNQLTLEGVKTYIGAMRDAVEQDITKTDLKNKEGILLQARLRNYMLLEAFLTSPEKAKQAIERAIAGFANRIKT